MNKRRNSLIKNGILLPVYYLQLSKQVNFQKKFIKEFLEEDLEFFKQKNDRSLSKKDFSKITGYYALGVPGVLGFLFSTLHNTKLSHQERTSLTYLGGISGLLDDLFDDDNRDPSNLASSILNPTLYSPKNTFEELLFSLYIKGLKVVMHPDNIKNFAMQVFKSQEQSIRQKEKNLDIKTLEKLTFEKGGNSFLYYRACLDKEISLPERELIYYLGGVMQFGNDIFDVWEDTKNSTNTLATHVKDIYRLEQMFFSYLENLRQLAYKCNFPKENINTFLNYVNLGMSRVPVCLNQFKNLQHNNNEEFHAEKYNRQQLICDMEKPENRVKMLFWFLNNN